MICYENKHHINGYIKSYWTEKVDMCMKYEGVFEFLNQELDDIYDTKVSDPVNIQSSGKCR